MHLICLVLNLQPKSIRAAAIESFLLNGDIEMPSLLRDETANLQWFHLFYKQLHFLSLRRLNYVPLYQANKCVGGACEADLYPLFRRYSEVINNTVLALS
jgi:hypothetical protein